jgi:hypothetical protein
MSPLASPIAIRTVDLVLLEGATLARESGPGAPNPSLGPGYRKLTLNRDGAQPGDRSARDRRISAQLSVPAVVCAFHGE